MTFRPLERFAQRWPDVACLAAVAAMVAHNHYNVRATRDVGGDDEAWYLASGTLLGKPGFPNGPDGWPLPELGSLHCLSYFPLSRLYKAPLDAFYAGWELRITLIALAVYLLVRRARRPWWQALAASFAFANCAVADAWPFPMHTATLAVLVGLVGASFARTTAGALGVTTIALAFAGFCRPELLVAYGVAVVVFGVQLAREARRVTAARARTWGKAMGWLLLTTVPAALLALRLGNPLGGTRAFFAFGQHYTLGLFGAQGSALDPWANWLPVVQRDFPGAATVFQAMRVNPSAFFAHVARNAARLPYVTMMATAPLLEASRWIERALWAPGVALAVSLAVRLLRRRDGVRTGLAQTALLFALGCGLVPFALSVLIVHPRMHYYVLVTVLSITVVASYPHPIPPTAKALMAKLLVNIPPRGARTGGIVLSCLLAVCLTGPKGGAASFLEWVNHRPAKRELYGHRQRASTRLRELRLEGTQTVLEYSWGTCFYAGYDCVPYLRWDKAVPLGLFLDEKGINLVVIDDEMLRDVRFADDPDCANFLAHPERYGFTLESVPGTSVRIGVRKMPVAK